VNSQNNIVLKNSPFESVLNEPTTALRCRSETEKNISEDLFSSELSKFKKYHPYGNLKFQFRHFPKLKIVLFNGNNPFNCS